MYEKLIVSVMVNPLVILVAVASAWIQFRRGHASVLGIFVGSLVGALAGYPLLQYASDATVYFMVSIVVGFVYGFLVLFVLANRRRIHDD